MKHDKKNTVYAKLLSDVGGYSVELTALKRGGIKTTK